ncbi:MAG TPA: sulfatase [Planctomycetota bacterium]|nr:sulfatase [Planctomycetota bacterium]
MERRAFFERLGSTAAAVALADALRAAESAPSARPNIVFAIADDWSWPHAGAYGDKVVKTPAFDRIASKGVLFERAYVAAASCTPSRGAILTGQWPHRLEAGGNLWSHLDRKFACYPDLLEAAGYRVGCTRKGWGPGSTEGTGRTRNPAGPNFRSFGEFLKGQPKDKPFCYWFGSHEPHRGYKLGSGKASGMNLDAIAVPPFLPDDPAVRSDIADYYVEVQMFDGQVGEILKALDDAGLAENTIVVMTSDNGMPFPRAKANCYEFSTHMPLAIRWPARVKGGRKVEEFVSFTDFAPTFLEAAGLKPLPEMTGRSMLHLLTGDAPPADAPKRDHVFVERERHAACRAGNASYPMRAIRTAEFLYLRNLAPDRWPAGDPPGYGDIDGGPSKSYLLEHKDDPKVARLFALACAKRPAEELYDLKKDPAELDNVADRPEYAEAKKRLRTQLDQWMAATADPRAKGGGAEFDSYPYVGGRPPQPKGKGKEKQ